MKKYKLLCTLSIFVILNHSAFSETTFTLRSTGDTKDKRYDYDNELFTLVLKKTEAKYGKFNIVLTQTMNRSRAQYSSEQNHYPNFFFKQSFSPGLEGGLIYVPFPVDLGIVGYRVCFTSLPKQIKLNNLEEMSQLKLFSFGLGERWTDVEILRYNGYEVVEKPSYDSLFRMVAAGRFDLFCRGVNEVLEEYHHYKHLDGLVLDSKWLFFYPMPRFYYTHKQNYQAMLRVKEGLEIAYKDGSLNRLWNKYYLPSVKFSKLEKRTLVSLETPYASQIDEGVFQYFYMSGKK